LDDIVLRGIEKWPNVPAVYGWLSLDRRGNWRIKGERISNPNVVSFIARNYGHDNKGRWFFQNGPQRVFVTLEYTPFVYRIINTEKAPLSLECHTTRKVTGLTGAWLDEAGSLLLQTEHGIGLVNDLDIDRVSPYFVDSENQQPDDDALTDMMELIQNQQQAPLRLRFRGTKVRIEPVNSDAVPQRFGFVQRPAQVSSRR